MNADTLRQAERLLAAGDVEGANFALHSGWPDLNSAPAEVAAVAGDIARAQNRSKAAIEFYTRAARLDPNTPVYRIKLGEALREAGAFERAADAFEQALVLDPDATSVRLIFARVLTRAARPAKAEAQARHVLAQAPSADAWDVLATALNAQGKLEEAIEASNEALKLDASLRQARNTRAVAMGRLGRVEDALREFEALTANGPSTSGLVLNRGDALLDLGRTAEAEQVLRDGVVRWPDHVGLHTALAKARWRKGEGAAFADAYEAAVAHHPERVALRLGCFDVLRRAGFDAKAEALLREGLKLAPEQPALLGALGVLLDELDRTSEAMPLLERVVARAPESQHSRMFLARALLRQGLSAEAMTHITPWRVRFPFDQTWISLETMALRQLGDARYHDLCDYDAMVQSYELPAPVGFASAQAFNALLAESLLRLHVDASHPLDQTLRDGTQTTRNLQHVDDPVVQAYLKALEEPIRAYIETMRDLHHPWSGRRTGAFKLSGAWSVRLRAGGRHVNHIHPGGWISSAYYVALPDSMASGAGHEGWIKFGEPLLPTPGCTIEKVIQPQVGRLVLFPSYIWHGTIPFNTGERLTAPFDVVPA